MSRNGVAEVMQKLVLIKLGGSLITDKSKPFTAREKIIKRVALEIKSAVKKLDAKIIISHGSGSFGHTVASRYKTEEGFRLEGLPEIADAAVVINRIVVRNFIKSGLSCVSFAPASFIYAKGEKQERLFLDPIRKALEIGFIPVVYGDIVLDEKKGFTIFSGERTLGSLAEKLSKEYKIVKIIYCGDTNGIYNKRGRTIRKITPASFQKYQKDIGLSNSLDVTGGMLHKVEEALWLAKKRIPSVIVDGRKKNEILNILVGKKHSGTLITI